MRAIRTEAQLTSFRSRADRGVGFSGVTPEMTDQEKCALFNLQNVLVEMLVYPKDAKDADVVEVKKEMDGKTHSQRLRAVLFVLWKQEGEKEPFEVFYGAKMERLIDQIKTKLEGQR